MRRGEDLLKDNQSTEENRINDMTTEVRTRADAYGFLATLCNQRPDLDLVRRLRSLGGEGFLGQIDPESTAEDIRRGLDEMSNFIAGMEGQSDEEAEQALAVDWTQLFRGLRPGYGPPPPYEGVYWGSNEKKVLQAVARCYQATGVAPFEKAANRPDYIGLELDFLRYLCEQQLEAQQKGDETQLETLQSAEHDFLKDHLGRWAAKYCEKAIEEAKTGFYLGFLHLIRGTVAEAANDQRPISTSRTK
jgi:TorA maturation chaperone TorD